MKRFREYEVRDYLLNMAQLKRIGACAASMYAIRWVVSSIFYLIEKRWFVWFVIDVQLSSAGVKTIR